MKPATKPLKRGRLRWYATALAAATVAAWLVGAWWVEVAIAAAPGQVSLRSGCLVIAHQVPAARAPIWTIGTVLAWPPHSSYGIHTRPLQERDIRWAIDWPPEARVFVFASGPVTSTGFGRSAAWAAPSGSIHEEWGFPLWPAVALTLLAAGWSWKRFLRQPALGRCARCGYDRSGLAAGAVCPECGV